MVVAESKPKTARTSGLIPAAITAATGMVSAIRTRRACSTARSECAPVLAGSELGQRGEHGGGDRRPEQCLGHLHDHPAIGERSHRTDLIQPRGKIVTGDDDQLDPEHGQQTGAKQFQCFDQTRMTQVKRRVSI